MAYQGSDAKVIAGLQELMKGRDAWEKIASTVGAGKSDKMPSALLTKYATTC